MSDFGHGAVNVSNVAGTALWALDYSLFASTQGIERIHYHQGVGYKYNFVSQSYKYDDTMAAYILPRSNRLRYTTPPTISRS